MKLADLVENWIMAECWIEIDWKFIFEIVDMWHVHVSNVQNQMQFLILFDIMIA